MRLTSLLVGRACCVGVLLAFAQACSGTNPDEAFVVDEEETSTSLEGVSGSLPVGSVLKTTGNLNFRTGPSTGYRVIDVLYEGTTVTTVRKDPSNGYYQVEYDGTVGWSHGNYMAVVSTPDTGEAGVTGPVPIGTTLETVTALYFRSGPAKSYGPLDVLPRGARVVTVNRTMPVEGYFQIEYGGVVGWSHGGYMTVVSSPGAGGGGDPEDPVCSGFSSEPLLAPSVCDGPGGHTSKEVPSNGLYSTSWFGCYERSDGSIYKDPYDNCEFACGPRGYCPSNQSGPECEADLKWFAAGADRYGCGGLVRVTNCENGKSVVLVTLDRGPNCNSVERKCGTPVMDMSYPAMDHLFDGHFYGGCDKKRVVVEVMPPGTPLGPM